MKTTSTTTPGLVTIPFMVLATLFCVCLISANLIEIKTVSIGFATITAGMAVFPLSYIINDCITEVYGFNKARMVIWLGFMMNLLFVLVLQLAILLPGADSWTRQTELEQICGSAPRILAASFVAFICGSMINAYVMSRMKVATGGRRFSLRAIVSTLFGEGADSLIFFPLAFYGQLQLNDIVALIIAQTLLKTAYEIVILPVTMLVVARLKKLEKTDTYDNNITYSLW
ncbi:MAG: queuosine precursor transporter [Muribaculum sp.]|nr:queuosine precursor transporter [Muribaculaceae bacterium]MCM1080463.1 queuosine precursor transporter [Muribaculum sp.]